MARVAREMVQKAGVDVDALLELLVDNAGAEQSTSYYYKQEEENGNAGFADRAESDEGLRRGIPGAESLHVLRVCSTGGGLRPDRQPLSGDGRQRERARQGLLQAPGRRHGGVHRQLPSRLGGRHGRQSAGGRGGREGGCLLYTSDAADDLLCVDLGGR